ncbi:acyl carrier protein [Virgibacillus proomii]|uniref:acyl carrier protein n=1 Tax=Virgibacillus proomii TaxID=84407 RepID=UPI001C10C2D0|nr:acyl carrier protein [Virgibacillus proomii]MBU5265926.1 acyl carrier protein [Virgibacillus proomii]
MESIQEIEKTVRSFLEENMIFYERENSLDNDDNIFELGFVDSMFALSLVTFIENNFEIKVESEDLQISNFSSINNITNFIQNKRQSRVIE